MPLDMLFTEWQQKTSVSYLHPIPKMASGYVLYRNEKSVKNPLDSCTLNSLDPKLKICNLTLKWAHLQMVYRWALSNMQIHKLVKVITYKVFVRYHQISTITFEVIQGERTDGRTKGNPISPFRNKVATGDKYSMKLEAETTAITQLWSASKLASDELTETLQNICPSDTILENWMFLFMERLFMSVSLSDPEDQVCHNSS